MKSAIIVFPGSNCDHDMHHALQLMGCAPDFVWHKTSELSGYDLVVLPGGFSYGDYLRSGAIARFSPIMPAVRQFARSGKPILGVCNGFQILVESGLLPGVLLRNQHLRFVCRQTYLQAVNKVSRFSKAIATDKPLKIPVAHGDGKYFLSSEELKQLQDNNQIVFRYVSQNGELCSSANPNGSVENVAGVINQEGNILGMMPHPERAVEKLLGSEDGRYIFESLLS